MTPDLLIAALETGESPSLRDVAGVSEAYFNRIAALLGEDPKAAVALGRNYGKVLREGDRKDFAWRARAAALRAEAKWRQSAEAFLRGAEQATDPLDRRIFALGAVDSFARAGQGDRAVRLGHRLARELTRLGSPSGATRARLNLANALIWQDRYQAAARHYRMVLAASPGEYERASAHLGLSTSLLYHGDLKEAAANAEAAGQVFTHLEMAANAIHAKLNLAHIALLEARPEDAWEILEPLRSSINAESERGRIEEFCGDALYGLNLFEDALRAYQGAAELEGAPLNRGNAWLGAGRTLVHLGREPEAVIAFRSAAGWYRKASNPVWTTVAEVERAKVMRHASRVVAYAVDLNAHKSSYWEAEALLAAATLGDEASLTRARVLVRQKGYSGLKWRVDWLIARHSGKLADYRRMREDLLADRLATRSTAARMSFLRDKRQALVDYLRRLAELDRFNEVVDVIARTRSAALVDEILGGVEFAPIRESLEESRAAFAHEESGTRRAPARVTRSLIGLNDRLLPARSAAYSGGTTTVWADLGKDLMRIDGQEGRILAGACIKNLLKWLEFEMVAPMANPQTDAKACNELIDQLREALAPIGAQVCPDGILWQAPWGLLAESAPVLSLSPAFPPVEHVRLPDRPRVCIWHQPSEELPWVEKEVSGVKHVFPEALVCSSAEAVRESMSLEFDLIHVATHARLNRENPMFSYFEFADGPVYAHQIARSGLRSKIAVLAACETGTFHLSIPDEPDGFVRSFLARGAEAVVAGQWPLDDHAAFETVVPLMQSLAKGEEVKVALDNARRVCRSKFAHPYYWGALNVYAGYGRDVMQKETP